MNNVKIIKMVLMGMGWKLWVGIASGYEPVKGFFNMGMNLQVP
jgi:hypothetical protein